MNRACRYLLLRRSGDRTLRAFAFQLIAEHEIAANRTANVASQVGVELPSTLSNTQYGALTLLNALPPGQVFEVAWLLVQLGAHAQSVEDSELEVAHGSDDRVHLLAAETLPVLRRHLARTQELLQAQVPPM